MKRFLSTLLTLCFLFVSLGMQAAIAEDAARAYSEKVIDLPDGYANLLSICVTANGAIVGAAQNKQGGIDLLTWNDGAAIPEILPLQYAGAIDYVDIAPDGQVMAISTNMERLMQSVREGQGQDQPTASGVANAPDGGTTDQPNINQPETNQAVSNQSITNQPDTSQFFSNQPASSQTFASQSSSATTNQATEPGTGTRQSGGNIFTSMGLETTILWFESDGTVGASFTLAQYGQGYKALSGRRIAMSGMQSNLAVYDDTGAIVHEFDQANVQSLAATDDTLFVITRSGIYAHNAGSANFANGAENFEQIRSIPFQINYSPLFFAMPDNTLYYADSDGINMIAPDADSPERVMDTVGTLIGDPSASVAFFGVKPDGSIVALVEEGGFMGTIGVSNAGYSAAGRVVSAGRESGSKSTLVIYSPIDASLIANRQVFLITALRSSNRLRKAVSDFQRLHPELKVVLQVQLEDDDTPVEDHIRTLNTDLLAGKGGDVIILDGLPIAQYAARGIIRDLSFLLPELGLLPGIASGLPDASGSVFSLPAQFSFQSLWGKKTDIELVQSLMDLVYANSSPDQSPMSARTPEELLRLFFPSSEASLKDAQGKLRFDSPEFEEFLEALYELYANQGESSSSSMPAMGGRSNRGGLNITELLSFYNGATAFFSLEVSGLMQISAAYSLSGGVDGGFITLPSIGGSGRAYTPSMRVGVNAASKHPDLAIEFVRLMFSNDVQEMDQMSALPTTIAALTKMFEDAKERSTGGNMRTMMMIPGGVSLEMSEPDESAWDALFALCIGVDTPATIDETLFDFIVSETANFFDGWDSAAVAGQAVERRAFYYLNE